MLGDHHMGAKFVFLEGFRPCAAADSAALRSLSPSQSGRKAFKTPGGDADLFPTILSWQASMRRSRQRASICWLLRMKSVGRPFTETWKTVCLPSWRDMRNICGQPMEERNFSLTLEKTLWKEKTCQKIRNMLTGSNISAGCLRRICWKTARPLCKGRAPAPGEGTADQRRNLPLAGIPQRKGTAGGGRAALRLQRNIPCAKIQLDYFDPAMGGRT